MTFGDVTKNDGKELAAIEGGVRDGGLDGELLTVRAASKD